MRKQFAGVTLTELLIAVLIGSVISLAITRLFTSGIRITQKGTSHLTNMQNAATLMMQIERDVERAEKILSIEEARPGELKARLAVVSPEGGLLIDYQGGSGNLGFKRLQSPAIGSGRLGETFSHVYCQGLLVQVAMKQSKVADLTGISVDIRVKAAAGNGEEETLARFIFCPNLLENRRITTFGWND